jgi:Fe-S cluster assembly ATP-binding protein
MLKIENLHVSVNDTPILKGLDMSVGRGEIHAIMGPNGSGKSTLASVLAGKDGYRITAGTVQYKNQDLLKLLPEERARAGVFLAFQ